MGQCAAVIFDWSGTLVYDPTPTERLSWALRDLGRPSRPDLVQDLLVRLEDAAQLSDVKIAGEGKDTDARRHRVAQLLLFERAGLDEELANRLYECDEVPENRPLFSDVLSVLDLLRMRGIRVGVLSDIHFDIRPTLAHHGAAHLIDSFVLSFEHGHEKPAPELFLAALGELESEPEETLMVGDTPERDGGACRVGIPTLVLAAQPDQFRGPRLNAVAKLTD